MLMLSQSTIIAGVDKSNGKVVLLPVRVPNKKSSYEVNMEKYEVFLGSEIAKTYSDAKKFTLERVNSFSDNSYLVLFQRIKLIDEFRGDVFFQLVYYMTIIVH